MKKANLAQELRERQYKTAQVPRVVIDELTNDDIIDAYVTCSSCGEKWISDDEMPIYIENADTVDEFLQHACH